MTPEQALQLLNQASEQAPLPKAVHVECQKAFIILKELIEKSKT